MSTPRSRRSPLPVIAATAALLLPLAACSSSSGSGASGDAQRLRVVMAFPPAQAMSPYGDDAVTLSRLAVIEGLTSLDKNGVAKPALATSWKQENPTTWTFTLRDAVFQDGAKVDSRRRRTLPHRRVQGVPAAQGAVRHHPEGDGRRLRAPYGSSPRRPTRCSRNGSPTPPSRSCRRAPTRTAR